MQSEFEGNESARRVSFVGKRYSIARIFTKDDDACSLHRTGVVWACVRMNWYV